MSKRNPWGEFFQNFDSAYNLGNKIGMQIGMAKAADVKPETITNTSLTDTTPTTSYKMGGKVQEQPFTPEQIEAQQFRNQADVAMHYGMAYKAAGLHGLAKVREEEGVTSQIKRNVELGLSRDHSDLKGMDREWKQIALAAEANLKAGRYDQYAALAKGAEGLQGKLLNNAMDKADLLTNPHAKLTAQLDAYNRYVLDARTGGGVTKNQDGSFTIKLSDGGEFTAKSDEDIAKVGMYLRDPKTVRKLQQEAYVKQRDRQTSREDKAWEWQNKPMEVGKDSTVFQPSTGKTFTPGANRKFDPKDQQAVGDDIRNHALQIHGAYDPASGKHTWTPKAIQVADTMESLFSNGHGLPVTQLRKIAEEGKPGQAQVTINGKPAAVSGVAFGGNLYLLDGSGTAIPMSGPKAKDAPPTTTGLGTREVRGRISSAPSGAPGLTPIAPQKKAEPIAYNAPELDKLAVSAAEENGVPPKLLLALKNAGEKSNNDQVSQKGASGVMQFMPATAKAYGVDPTNPESSIRGAGRYLADLIKQYRGNVAAAVAHYNGGSTQGTLVAAGKEPTYPETRAYLERVLAAAG